MEYWRMKNMGLAHIVGVPKWKRGKWGTRTG